MPYFTAGDGTEICYRDWGFGAPVILIHGWPLTSDMWDKQAGFLVENGLRVITYDRRGFGRSGQPWSGYDYDTLAADLNALIELLELEGATLVGFSMGGGEVIRYLSTYGANRIDQAVLISAVTPFLLQTEDNPGGVPQSVFDGIEQSIRQDRPAFFKEFASKFFGRTLLDHTVSESVLDWYQFMAFTASEQAILATAASWSSTDFRDEMALMTVPVRVIHGSKDATVPIDLAGRRSVEILQNATLTEYEGEPHGLFLTAADTLNEELLGFITQTENESETLPA